MKVIKRLLLLVTAFSSGYIAMASDSLWTLDECIRYAKAHNISIRQQEINERITTMNEEQARLSQLPGVSFSAGYGSSFGRSINPTTNQFENTKYNYTGLNGSGSVLLFGWFQKRNTIIKSDLLRKAEQAKTEQLKDNVSLNVATGYLRILLAQEQINIAKGQLLVSKQKQEQTAALLKAGRSNGLDMAQMNTQLTMDSTLYFRALLDFQQAVIDLKAILNLSIETSFIPTPVSQEEIPVQRLYIYTAEKVYQVAVFRMGNTRSSELKVESAEKDVVIAKSGLYPQLSLSASTGTNYSSTFFEITPGGSEQLMPWGKQLQNNFSQSLSINLSIPVFNGLSTRHNIRQAKMWLQIARLGQQQTESDLRQAVYKAWNEAKTALQNYLAIKSAAETAATGLYFAQERYDKGVINAADFLRAKNMNFKAHSDEASAKYDLIFKLKVIDYYLGKQ